MENQVRYVYDTSDLSAFAKVQTPIDQAFPTFATWVTEADIVAVNGKLSERQSLARGAPSVVSMAELVGRLLFADGKSNKAWRLF